MKSDAYFKCNRHGKGFRIRNGTVTTFEERILFLRQSSNHGADEKALTPKVETSSPAEEESSSSASAIKRKVDENSEDDESIKEAVSSVKRIKNESSNANTILKEKGETSVEESLFCNDLLLRTIFANLGVEDLKSCRAVNSLWNLETTKMLLQRDCLAAIQISNDAAAIHDTAEYKLPTPLQDFRQIITNSKLVPLSSFLVDNRKLGDYAVDFFRENGHLVKTFCFEPEEGVVEMGDEDATPGDILLLASACFPNLTKLKFVRVYEGSTPALTLLAIDKCPDLINLHTLEITAFFPEDVIALILKKAKSLQNIYLHAQDEDFDYSRDLEKLMELGNVIPRLRNIHLLFSDEALQRYQQLVKQNPRFSSIGSVAIDRSGWVDPADVDPENVAPIITAIFHQCSDSLTEILDVNCLQALPGLSFPVFPNVKRLEIQLQCLPSLLNLAQVFPNLKTFEVEGWEGYKRDEFFSEFLSPSLSVRHLKVTWGEGHIPKKWVKMFCLMFPNATSAKFCNPIWDSAYKYLWKLSALHDLQLEIWTKPMKPFLALDSAFTGFSVDTVKNLFQMDAAELNMPAKEVESLRVKPSIVDLKTLRKLSLRLFDTAIRRGHCFPHTKDTFGQKNVEVIFDKENRKELLEVDGVIILSFISKRFGFDLCPWLNSNVSVGYTYYTKLNAGAEDETSESDSE